MKKISLVLLTLVLLCTLVAPTFAAKTAFENVVLSPDTNEFGYIPNTDGLIRKDNVIKYVEGYGCGFGTKGDSVQFKNLDFGANGADKMTISFSYGDPNTSTLAVYLDSLNSAPIATFAITSTGGWDIPFAKEFTTAVKVPGGVHDIYVQFTNEESGSFSYIRFNEAKAPVTAAGTAAAAPTADMGLIVSLAAVATSAAGFVALGKKR